MTLFEELKARGLIEAMTDASIEQKLEKPMVVYCGFDPSAKSLQLGNMVSIMFLKRLQMAGHQIIALVGGATGLIGDPSGKSTERNMLTVEQVNKNKIGIRENLSRILDFSGNRPCIFVDNFSWYDRMSAIEFLRDLGVNFRVPQMLAKESVKKRYAASEGALTFTEFSYQILQGNDFLHLYDTCGCELEVGGADQWGNITAGTDLVHRMRGTTVYGLTFPLLLDSTGKKFGKSEGNALFMDKEMTSPFDWYQYFIRTPDADVIQYLKVFSLKSLDEIAQLEAQMKEHPEARIPQRALAEEMTLLVHGREELEKVKATTESLYAKSSGADLSNAPGKDMKHEDCLGKPVFAVAFQAGMFSSNSEARRMAQQNGLALNGKKVDVARVFNADDIIDGKAVLKKGKQNYFVLRFA